jgi:hypothetical protein
MRRAKDIPSCATCSSNLSPYLYGCACSETWRCSAPEFIGYTLGKRKITKAAASPTVELVTMSMIACVVFGGVFALLWWLL